MHLKYNLQKHNSVNVLDWYIPAAFVICHKDKKNCICFLAESPKNLLLNINTVELYSPRNLLKSKTLVSRSSSSPVEFPCAPGICTRSVHPMCIR